MKSLFGTRSCVRMNKASTPPTTKNKRAATPYMMPIRLWSTVVIQLQIPVFAAPWLLIVLSEDIHFLSSLVVSCSKYLLSTNSKLSHSNRIGPLVDQLGIKPIYYKPHHKLGSSMTDRIFPSPFAADTYSHQPYRHLMNHHFAWF